MQWPQKKLVQQDIWAKTAVWLQARAIQLSQQQGAVWWSAGDQSWNRREQCFIQQPASSVVHQVFGASSEWDTCIQLTAMLVMTCYTAELWPDLRLQSQSDHCLWGYSGVVRHKTSYIYIHIQQIPFFIAITVISNKEASDTGMCFNWTFYVAKMQTSYPKICTKHFSIMTDQLALLLP